MKFLIASIFCCSGAFAQNSETQNTGVLPAPTVKISAEADFFFELAHMPSSVKGQARFDIALLQISPELFVNENLGLHFRFVLAEERSATEKNYLSELQNGFVRYVDPRFLGLTHELGLIRLAWIASEKTAGELDFFGDSAKSLSRRYGMLAEGELGYQGRFKQNDHIEWVFGFGNGEENQDEEQGPNKEAFVGSFYKRNDLLVQLWLSSGRVDDIDTKINQKNRAILRLQEKWGRFSMALEGLYAQDSSLDLSNQGRLEGITFTELIEPKEVTTSGGRIELGYDLLDQQKALIRFDQITPESEKKSIRSLQTAWTKRESINMIWGVYYERTDFGAQHSSLSRVRELGRLGLEIAF